MLYRFTHLSGTNSGHVDSVETSPPIVMGREDSCQVKFDKYKDLSVSAQHAKIEEISEGTWQIVNLSKNGLMVNGIPCDATAKLPNHATIQLGKDGPRVRFDVDQNVAGISKADIVRREKTKKIMKGEGAGHERLKAPDTEERPVLQIQEPEKPAEPADKKQLLLIGVVVGGVILLILLGLLIAH